MTPPFSDAEITRLVNQYYGLSGELSELPGYIDLNRQLTASDGKLYVVKVANALQNSDELDFENKVMMHLAADKSCSLQIPCIILNKDKQALCRVTIGTESSRVASATYLLRIISFLPGELWAKVDTDDVAYARSLGAGLAMVDQALESFKHPAANRYLAWDMRHSVSIVSQHLNSITANAPVVAIENKKLVQSVLEEYKAQVLPCYQQLPVQVIHNDANDYNLLVNSTTKSVCGLFDFGDMVSSFRIAELAISAAYAMMQKTDPAAFLEQMVVAYHQTNQLAEVELSVLLSMVKMRLAVSVCMSAHQYAENPDNDYLLVSQKEAWLLLRALDTTDCVALTLKLQYLCGAQSTDEYKGPQQIIEYRKKHLSENLSLAYEQPIKIIRGQGAYLYSEQGERYLDMVNNVCHVGHCHSRVVNAGQQQMALLNTNTRYLHDNIIQFSEKLLSTMPEKLSVCMFVNSGSEANELALRIARTYTKSKAMVVVNGAYHGNANACIDISPYKFDGPGGAGSPDWVKQTLVADPYRGKYRGFNAQTGRQYAEDVKRVIEEFKQEGQSLCGFICESIQGVGGQVVHPPEYLKAAYQHVRDAGGLCIADEVQVGMGRVGTHWWAFQTQDVVPDIVTIGKPLGNGHPLAALVTTKEIADAFVNGMEYFNTFGGNPVSCAIGKTVMDVVESEDLMAHAIETGDYIQQGLKQLQQRFPIIGDVRGLGMFIGAEFVACNETLEPAVTQIDYVIERLKQKGILLTTEGPLHNVLKIKPPLPFSKKDADFFLNALAQVLSEKEAQLD